MAKYTMSLGSLLASGYHLWDFDYPIIAGYRDEFERKFNLEFYDREINFLSADEFKRHLNARLNLIMPYYVQLQKSEHLIDCPFRTFNMVESTHRADDSEVFYKAMDNAMTHSENRGTSGSRNDLNYSERTTQNVIGHVDGVLDRDTTDSRTTDFTLDEHTDDDTVRELERDRTQDETVKRTTHEDTTTDRDVKRDIKTDRTVTTDSTDNLTEHRTRDTDYQETTHETEETDFSDTPQENFVIGNYDERGRPLSQYATTLTLKTTNGNKNSTENVTEEHTADDVKHQDEVTAETVADTTAEDVKGTRDETVDTTDNITEKVTEDEATERDITTHRDTLEHENAVGTLNDATSEHSTEDSDRRVEGQQITTDSEQTYNEGHGTSTNLKDSTRSSKSNETNTHQYSGYKYKTESEMLLSYRKTFLNIDRDIFRDCEVLFLGIY